MLFIIFLGHGGNDGYTGASCPLSNGCDLSLLATVFRPETDPLASKRQRSIGAITIYLCRNYSGHSEISTNDFSSVSLFP